MGGSEVMKAMNIMFGVTAITSVIFCACCPDFSGLKSGETRREFNKIKIAEGKLKMREFRKGGVFILLPKDVMDVEIWQSDDVNKSSTIFFVLSKVPLAKYNIGDTAIVGGHINVLTPEQYLDWKASPDSLREGGELIYKDGKWGWDETDEIFDTLQVHDSPENKYGLFQTVYRMDHKAPDGRVFQAMITRMHYTDNQSVIDEEVTLITNILNSVRFIKE